MHEPGKHPNTLSASAVVTAMTGDPVISIKRMETGEQNFVYAVKTSESEYVIRMTEGSHKNKFIAAIYWQEKLITLGVPLAKFIHIDLENQYSPFPSLLMKRLPGDDLINIYPHLTDSDKKTLANKMVRIQSLLNKLPEASFYGYSDSYEHPTENKSWYDFLINRLNLLKGIIAKNAIFDPDMATKGITIAKNMEKELREVRATPFLWDASERNVMVHHGKISGIVDVDEICFGDPLFVIALTATALESEGYDTAYTDYWAYNLNLDHNARRRLEFYRLFYAVTFMRKHAMQTVNKKKASFDVNRLNNIYLQALQRIRVLL